MVILGGPVFLTSEVPLLGPYGGPRGVGAFLWARYPCTEGGGKLLELLEQERGGSPVPGFAMPPS